MKCDLEDAVRKARGSVCSILGDEGQNDVEDVLQVACIKALTGSPFQGKCAYSSWFTRIAINCALMWRRSHYGEQHKSQAHRKHRIFVSNEGLEDRPDQKPTPEALAIANEHRALLRKWISELTPKAQEAIQAWLAGRRLRGLNTNAFKSRIFNAKEQLRRISVQEGARARRCWAAYPEPTGGSSKAVTCAGTQRL